MTDADAAQYVHRQGARERRRASRTDETYNGVDYLARRRRRRRHQRRLPDASAPSRASRTRSTPAPATRSPTNSDGERAALDEVPDEQPLLRLRRHAGGDRPGRELGRADRRAAEAVRGAGRPVQRGPDQLLGRRSATTRSASPARRPAPTDGGGAERPGLQLPVRLVARVRGRRRRRAAPDVARRSSSRASRPASSRPLAGLPGRRASTRSVRSRRRPASTWRRDLASIGDVGGFVEGTRLLGLGGGLVDRDRATSRRAAEPSTGSRRRSASERSISDHADRRPASTSTVRGAPGRRPGRRRGRQVRRRRPAQRTVDDVLSPDETLDDSDRFNAARDALGDDMTPAFFLDFAPILAAGREHRRRRRPIPTTRWPSRTWTPSTSSSRAARSTATGRPASLVLGVKEARATTSEDAAAAVITP